MTRMEYLSKTAHSTRPVNIRGKRTNVTTRQNFTPSWDGLEIDKEAIFPPLGPQHSRQYHCHFLQFKIIAPNIHNDTGIRRWNADPNSDHKRTKISSDNNQLEAQLLYLYCISPQSSTCFEHYMLIIRRLNSTDAASGIVLSVSGRPVHRLRENSF